MMYLVQKFADWLTLSVMSLAPDSHLYHAVSFFIYDTIKIFFLLFVIIFIVTVVRTYLSPEKVKKFLSRKHSFVGNILAAVIGIFTPFCTCSAIPLFLGFLQAGVPVGVTFSFLIASPMINEIALALLFGMFGWKIALLFVTSGLAIAVVAGVVLGKLGVEKYIINLDIEQSVLDKKKNPSLRARLRFGWRYTQKIVKKIWPYVIIGIALGGFIHGYVPTDFLASYAGADKWYAVPLATLLGIPLYSNAAGIIPLVSVLTDKGVAIGTVLAFMMAVTALSLPEFLILKKVMTLKLVLIFASIVGLGIIVTGYLFNILL